MKKIQGALNKELSLFCSLPAVVWQLFFMVLPLLVIFYYSVAGDGAWWHITWDHYRALFQLSYFKIIGRSLLLSVATAFTGLILAYPVAYYLALHVRRFKSVMLFLFTLPFWVNFLIQIYAWYFLLERNGIVNAILLRFGLISEPEILLNSIWAVFLVMLYCYIPFIIMPLYSTLEKIDIRLLEASADLGATPWQTFCRITIPYSMPSIKTGILLVMIPAFGEFVIPALVGGSRHMLVGSLISYYFLAARNNYAGAAFTCLSGVVLLLVLIVIAGVSRLLFWRKYS